MSADPSIRDHQTWLNYLQPDGLVVSPTALVDAQVLLPHNALPLQERFLPFVEEFSIESDKEGFAIKDFVAFCRDFLEWPDDCLFGVIDERPIPESLIVSLPELGLTLSPSLAFRDPNPKDAEKPWLLLAQTLPLGTDLDAHQAEDESGWKASHSRRFERLLRETKVPIGLLSNGTHIRLTYAPHGENSGSITFPVAAMTEVAGRSILAAFHLLLDRYRLLAAPTDVRLPALLARSREYQSRVSAALAQQVLDSLYELQRGFQAANERTAGELLRSVLAERPDDVYAGLLTVLMRLVFLLFAEDRGLMPTSELYVRNYSIHGLFERLRSDNEHYPDTMDQRYGAWAQLLAVFRSVYHGSRHPHLHMPARHGHLFDPTRFPFLDGRAMAEARVPLVSDGTIIRILEKLLILGGERLSYRTLDVEEIGSVYQTVMGFRLEIASGPSIAILSKRKHKSEVTAPTVINLDDLRLTPGKDRAKWLKERTNQEVTGEADKALRRANGVAELLAALDRKIARNATPAVVPRGVMVLQPTDERRRSGSHYTPRSFTEPIVRKTLAPILERLGQQPTPDQILELKVCDLAVGSGAFLVEACRQLGDALIKAWQDHRERPPLPADETEELLARRLVAQRCMYAVDRNPMATDLAKLSLWLATLAKDHPFTFLDHSIRVGDALVGLTRQQIADFHWVPERERAFGQDEIEGRIRRAAKYRKRILEGGDFVTPQKKHEQLELADEALKEVRFVGNIVIAAFFSATKDKARRIARDALLRRYIDGPGNNDYTVGVEEVRNLTTGEFPVTPFHWEIEFPEVFDRENSGFDIIVGNPPYGGKNNLVGGNREGYLDWLKTIHIASHGNADLVAHFFRRAFNLLSCYGCFGLIATNTIRQGDTRATGLRWICSNGGTVYAANRRYKWPGQAAVVVSIVWITRAKAQGPFDLDGRSVSLITAYLFHAGGHQNPAALKANQGKCFIGSYLLGMGFTFDDTDKKGVANPIGLMQRLITQNSHNAERIFPYIGGKEVNDEPEHHHHRFVINFADFPLRRDDLGLKWGRAEPKQRDAWLRRGVVPYDYPEPVAADWPDLLAIVERKVKPERDKLGDDGDALRRKSKWWLMGRYTPGLFQAVANLDRVIVTGLVNNRLGFTFMPTGMVFSKNLAVFPLDTFAAFCALQCRIHEVWARLFSSTFKDDLNYAPSDCFETFPFPTGFDTSEALEQAGQQYYDVRASLMIRNNEGLTKTYNRFHDPEDTSSDILALRDSHAGMDRAVLEAYVWHDIAEKANCEFLLDHESEEDSDDDRPASRRKKPWRYRWPDETCDEVLARLLALNAKRAEEEKLAGNSTSISRNKPSKLIKRTVSLSDQANIDFSEP
ncbi:MAG TPA: DNA methyltransferase [Pyrinomonadaceae bacterium]|nr:DNA methyltransferase [Pyrinomonadaceae bacterium]